MLCICFSDDTQPFAMLLPLSGFVVVFCCSFLRVFFNSASIAPLADFLAIVLCHPSSPSSFAIHRRHSPLPSIVAMVLCYIPLLYSFAIHRRLFRQ